MSIANPVPSFFREENYAVMAWPIQKMTTSIQILTAAFDPVLPDHAGKVWHGNCFLSGGTR